MPPGIVAPVPGNPVLSPSAVAPVRDTPPVTVAPPAMLIPPAEFKPTPETERPPPALIESLPVVTVIPTTTVPDVAVTTPEPGPATCPVPVPLFTDTDVPGAWVCPPCCPGSLLFCCPDTTVPPAPVIWTPGRLIGCICTAPPAPLAPGTLPGSLPPAPGRLAPVGCCPKPGMLISD